MVLDGDHDTSIHVATEVSVDLDATVIGVGSSRRSRLLRSRYCDEGVAAPRPPSDYRDALVELSHAKDPDVVLPIGYRSVTALDAIRGRLPESVEFCIPPSTSLKTAFDKRATLSLASAIGIDTPADYTARIADVAGRRCSQDVRALPYPVFLKARHECGETLTAKVDGPGSFWPSYEELRRQAGGDDILVQEYLDDPRTFGCGLLFVGGSELMRFEHEELRSVPRLGGSGTRLRIHRDSALESTSASLLRELDWRGPALVEYKVREDGTFLLMEINPKLWASYALASQSGYRFVSTLVASLLDLPWSPRDVRRQEAGEMVFPLRELKYVVTHPGESIVRALAAMCWPPARIDVNLTDVRPWITVPWDLEPASGGERRRQTRRQSTERAPRER